MNKNPVVWLIGLSLFFFVVFLAFVYLVVGSLTKNKSLLNRNMTNIGVVKVHGVIMDSQHVLADLKEMEEAVDVKGIILRINSPGGAVGPSQEIYDAILRVKKTKPVVASFEAVAASGGYYVAVAADKIVSNPGALTGSIGVIMEFTNLSDLYNWAKVKRFNIKSGKFKDTGSESRDMTTDEKELMQGLIDNVYGQFLKAVSDGRKLPIDRVKPFADGRVLTGEQAFQNGFVDSLGGIDRATDMVKELAKIEPSQKIRFVYPEPKRKNVWDLLGQGAAEGLLKGILEKMEGLSSQMQMPNGSKALFFM